VHPTYFTVGNLVQYLQGLETKGIPRQEILDNYVFSRRILGPCRSACRKRSTGSRCKTPGLTDSASCCSSRTTASRPRRASPGLKFTVDFGIGMLNALEPGDVMNDLIYQIRPYEVNKG